MPVSLPNRLPIRLSIRLPIWLIVCVFVLVSGTAGQIRSVVAQEIVVDPNSTGADNVETGSDPFFSAPLTNPVTSPLNLLPNNSLWVGNSSQGELLISGGGLITAPEVTIGNFANSTGVLTVTGNGSTLLHHGDLVVGREGNGTLNVSNGGLVSSQDFSSLHIASTEDSIGAVNINGPGSRLEAFNIRIASGGLTEDSSISSLTISGGGIVENTGDTIAVGGANNSTGIVTVTGAGSELRGNGMRFVLGSGNQASAQLNVLDGGFVSTRDFELGSFASIFTESKVVVDGQDSLLSVAGTLLVGDNFDDSSGELFIRNGGRVNARSFLLDATSSGLNTGSAFVTDGGTLHIDEEFALDSPNLNFAGGTLSLGGDRVYDGSSPFVGLNQVLNQRNGILSNNETLKIEGNLNVLSGIRIDGATLSAGTISNIGSVDFRRGTLELTSTDVNVTDGGQFGDSLELNGDQTLKVSQGVRVASDGRVALTGGRLDTSSLRNEGLVTGSGRINGELINSVGGEIRVGAGQSLRFSGAANENRGGINLLGANMLEFDQHFVNKTTGTVNGRGAIVAHNGLTNEGVFRFSGGASDVVGTVDNTGTLSLEGGAVATFQDDFVNTGVLNVNSFGSTTSAAVFFGDLGGAGDITGGGDVFALGGLNPGNSPGSINVHANLFLASSTFTEIEIAGMQSGEFDQLLIDGDLEVAGELAVSLLNGFELQDGMEFMIFDIDGISSGRFDGLADGDRVGRFGNHDLFISYSSGDGNDISLFTSTSIPEPATTGLLLAGMAGVLTRRSRNRVAA